MDALPVFYGVEPLQSADRRRAELEMHENSIQEMTTTLSNGIVAQEPNVILQTTGGRAKVKWLSVENKNGSEVNKTVSRESKTAGF